MVLEFTIAPTDDPPERRHNRGIAVAPGRGGRAVVHRHHGSIALTEHDGPGTTVLVRLPLDAR